ncbi:MAG: radical SAM protein [Mycoplasma sp.]|nr:radical SAM protein [Mycoplasma sp.]
MKIDKVIIKTASRCNINCTYCFMYNMGDTSYKKLPKFISNDTTSNFVEKILNHCKKNDIDTFWTIIHGGEPLLMNKQDFVEFINAFDLLKENGITPLFSLQTNGILVDNEWCDIFKKYNIDIGVSLDGTKEIHDLSRVDKKGNGTYDNVIKGMNILKKNKVPFGGLSVMNPETSSIDIYNSFKEQNIYGFDILFLDTNYDHIEKEQKSLKMYEWYKELFDKWFKNDSKIRIRLFDIIIKNILGQATDIDMLGTGENNVLVLETDGELEPVDSLKICGEEFTKTNLNVNNNILIDDVSKNDLIDIYYNSGKYLPKKCLACPVQEICGGGYISHRYSSKNGFNNPSVYCDDLLKLITYIQNAVIDGMPEELIKESGIQKLTYENALQIIEETLPTISEPEYVEKLESFRNLEYEVI